MVGLSTGDFTVGGSSASGSYPNFAIRSASSLAFFSAASKSMASAPRTFFAPSFVFLPPRMFALFDPPVVAVLRNAAELVVREAAGAFASDSLPPAPALRNGEAVLLMTGVCDLDGGLLGRLMAGLSQEEKKSSAGSPEGVEVPSAEVGDNKSVTSTSSGYLEMIRVYQYIQLKALTL